MTDAQLFRELSSLPDDLKREVADFIEFLKTKLPGKEQSLPKRPLGIGKGMIEILPGFDDQLDD